MTWSISTFLDSISYWSFLKRDWVVKLILVMPNNSGLFSVPSQDLAFSTTPSTNPVVLRWLPGRAAPLPHYFLRPSCPKTRLDLLKSYEWPWYLPPVVCYTDRCLGFRSFKYAFLWFHSTRTRWRASMPCMEIVWKGPPIMTLCKVWKSENILTFYSTWVCLVEYANAIANGETEGCMVSPSLSLLFI